MQTNYQELEVLCGDIYDFSALPLSPFDKRVCAFLNEVSTRLLHLPAVREYPDITTFAFFCRRANLTKLSEEYRGKIENRLGRGMTFHIAPSNVPINFAYTLVTGLLAGNMCVVKASSKDFAQTRIIADVFNRVLSEKDHNWLVPYIKILIYPRDRQDLTGYFSSKCNVRVIWGGDRTIAEVRKSEIPPRAFDITFADRYSICVINASEIEKETDLSDLAHDFYNDTYLYDQNACSSPRLIYWIGEAECVKRAQERFWNAVYEEIKDKYIMEPVTSVDKYMAFCRAAIDLDRVNAVKMPDRRIDRIEISNPMDRLPDYRCAGGSYIEYASENLDVLFRVVDERYQTLSYFGMDAEQLRKDVIGNGMKGIDRIVPVGKTADFGVVWDGSELILMMSRIVAMK